MNQQGDPYIQPKPAKAELVSFEQPAEECLSEEALVLLIRGGKEMSEISAALGTDATRTVSLVLKALDRRDVFSLIDNIKISTLRMQHMSDDMAKKMSEGKLTDRGIRTFLEVLKTIISTTNETIQTQAELLSKASEAQVSEFAEMVEAALFTIAFEMLDADTAQKLIERVIARL